MIYTTKCAGRDALYERMSERKVMIDKQKETNMTNKTTEHKPKITLEHGKAYVTAAGNRVTVYSKRGSDDFYKFEGSNGYNYGANGKGFKNSDVDYSRFNIVSEYKEPDVQPKVYTAKEARDLAEQSYYNGLAEGKSPSNIFSTPELQSLTKMQSKVIAALEAEILELKETAAYLGNCVGLVNRVNGLRKQIFNEITTKKKRLVKLVALQARMKRSK